MVSYLAVLVSETDRAAAGYSNDRNQFHLLFAGENETSLYEYSVFHQKEAQDISIFLRNGICNKYFQVYIFE